MERARLGFLLLAGAFLVLLARRDVQGGASASLFSEALTIVGGVFVLLSVFAGVAFWLSRRRQSRRLRDDSDSLG